MVVAAYPIRQGLRVGLVSVAPPTEISGQGRVLGRLLAGSHCIAMSEFADLDDARFTGIRLSPPAGEVSRFLSDRKYESAATYARILETVRMRAREIARATSSYQCSVVIGCSGSPFDLAAAALAARRCSVPFAAYLFDDAIGQWPSGPYKTAAKLLSRIWRSAADLLIVPNEFVASAWGRHGLRTVVIRNPLPDSFAATDRTRFEGAGPADRVNVVYTGSVYHAQADAFHNVIAALERFAGQVHLHVFTNQPASWVEACGVNGPHVTRHEPVAAHEIPNVLASASVLLLPLGFNTGIPEAIRTASPGKLGEYLAAGRPILAHVPPDSYVAAFCREKNCAVVVDTPDHAALEKALGELQQGGSVTNQLQVNAEKASEEFKLADVREKFWAALHQIAR